jgi:hypothetical protein
MAVKGRRILRVGRGLAYEDRTTSGSPTLPSGNSCNFQTFAGAVAAAGASCTKNVWHASCIADVRAAHVAWLRNCAGRAGVLGGAAFALVA